MYHQHLSTEEILKGRVRKNNAWRIISDISLYPTLMTNVNKVIVHKRNENEGKSEWFITVDNAPVHWIENDHYDELNYRMLFQSIEGDFERIDGAWIIEDYNGEGIRLEYTMDYRLGIPVIEEVVGPVLEEKMKNNIDSMIRSIMDKLNQSQQAEERKFPRTIINRYNTINLDGKEIRVYVCNISQLGMMFVPTIGLLPAQAHLKIDEIIIKADVFTDAGSLKKSRAIFHRELRQGELESLEKYFMLNTKHC